MTRNPNQRTREGVRYNRNNPPRTEEEAKDRVDQLSGDITCIETDLEHKQVESFADDAAYEAWRSRAIAALALKKTEFKFLRDWLKGVDQAKKPDLMKISQEIRDRAKNMAEEIRPDYVRVYDAEHLPSTPNEAHQRLAAVGTVRVRVQACLSEISAAWVQYPLRRSDLIAVKAPLVEILNEIEAEAKITKAFITKDVADALPKRRFWKSVCVTALTRAAVSGFVLTPEEQEVLNDLVADLAARASALD